MFHWYKILMKLNSLLLLPGLLLAGCSVQAEQLSVDTAHSKINVAVSATIDSFVGHLKNYQADIDYPSNARLPDKARVSFNFKDLKTGNPSRDKEMLKWLNYSQHPSCTFTFSDWKNSGTTNLADGTITIHGVKEKIQMPVNITWNGTHCDISGSANLNYHDFGLPTIRKMLLLTVNPHLHITFHLTGTLPAK